MISSPSQARLAALAHDRTTDHSFDMQPKVFDNRPASSGVGTVFNFTPMLRTKPQTNKRPTPPINQTPRVQSSGSHTKIDGQSPERQEHPGHVSIAPSDSRSFTSPPPEGNAVSQVSDNNSPVAIASIAKVAECFPQPQPLQAPSGHQESINCVNPTEAADNEPQAPIELQTVRERSASQEIVQEHPPVHSSHTHEELLFQPDSEFFTRVEANSVPGHYSTVRNVTGPRNNHKVRKPQPKRPTVPFPPVSSYVHGGFDAMPSEEDLLLLIRYMNQRKGEEHGKEIASLLQHQAEIRNKLSDALAKNGALTAELAICAEERGKANAVVANYKDWTKALKRKLNDLGQNMQDLVVSHGELVKEKTVLYGELKEYKETAVFTTKALQTLQSQFKHLRGKIPDDQKVQTAEKDVQQCLQMAKYWRGEKDKLESYVADLRREQCRDRENEAVAHRSTHKRLYVIADLVKLIREGMEKPADTSVTVVGMDECSRLLNDLHERDNITTSDLNVLDTNISNLSVLLGQNNETSKTGNRQLLSAIPSREEVSALVNLLKEIQTAVLAKNTEPGPGYKEKCIRLQALLKGKIELIEELRRSRRSVETTAAEVEQPEPDRTNWVSLQRFTDESDRLRSCEMKANVLRSDLETAQKSLSRKEAEIMKLHGMEAESSGLRAELSQVTNRVGDLLGAEALAASLRSELANVKSDLHDLREVEVNAKSLTAKLQAAQDEIENLGGAEQTAVALRIDLSKAQDELEMLRHVQDTVVSLRIELETANGEISMLRDAEVSARVTPL